MESSDGQDVQAQEVLDDVGMSNDNSGELSEAQAQDSQTTEPLYVQKRLKQQKRTHEREIRELHQRINEMQSASNQQQTQYSQAMTDPNSNQLGNQMGGMDEQTYRAVSYALQHKDLEERRAKDAESKQHIAKQYDELQRHLDKTSDKYDDFDDVVRGEAPFTPHMRDAALFLPKTGAGSAGEVFYKLGKNPDELSRISRLHPIDQASELVKLSHTLINDGGNKNPLSRPLGNIKSNPVNNSHAVNEKTSVSELRKRMRSNWK